MNFLKFCNDINNLLAVPATLIFIGTAIYLTIKTNFLQFRAFGKFIALIKENSQAKVIKGAKTISPIQALFTAMATTMGMGNIVGPTIAIITGGPGAIFWMILYMILSSATKFTEVTFALFSRKITSNGDILGGPSQYLALVSPAIANWYGFITLILFAGWSGLQANTLGKILEQEGIPAHITGLVLAALLVIILFGGVKRVGSISSKLVPIMFVLYVSFALVIIFTDISALKNAIYIIFSNIFKPAAAVGGFLGATIFDAIRWGTYRGIYITEAGIGTSSIPHSFANTKNPTDQGLLAMYGVVAEIFLCLMSALVVLVTGVWTKIDPGTVTNTLIYEAFKMNSPIYGKSILIFSVTLFVLTTIVGNGFSGGQSFAAFTKYRFIKVYYLFAALITFLGAISQVKLIWDIMDIFLALVAIPNLIGLIILSKRYSEVLKVK